MICYKDMTFCNFEDCQNFSQNKCHRAFTKELQEDADMWWGKPGAPIAFFMGKPDCFEEKNE